MALAAAVVFSPRSLSNTTPILVDQKRHHSGITILGRIGQYGETASHGSLDHVFFRSTTGQFALFCQYPIKAALEGLGWLRIASVALGACLSNEGSPVDSRQRAFQDRRFCFLSSLMNF
jgi:hypothetical protein